MPNEHRNLAATPYLYDFLQVKSLCIHEIRFFYWLGSQEFYLKTQLISTYIFTRLEIWNPQGGS